MSDPIDFAGLPVLPQINFLYQLAPLLWRRPDVLALWVEGSLARGNADRYSDVDLYVGVEPTALAQWRALAVPQLFGDHYGAHIFSHFAEDFFVYHVYLTAGGIYDLHIQPRNRELPPAHRLILACRADAYRTALAAATPAAGDSALPFPPQPLDPTTIAPLLTFFWINADKSRKVLYRNQDFTMYTGLHLFRQVTARLHFMAETGCDCGDLTRSTIHGLKAVALALGQSTKVDLGKWMGAPATTRLELCHAQALLHEEVARVGRTLAARYQIPYPAALEQTVLTNWRQFMTAECGLA